jgi:hypothetical protein
MRKLLLPLLLIAGICRASPILTSEFTQSGWDYSLQFDWSDLPAGAYSLVITVDDAPLVSLFGVPLAGNHLITTEFSEPPQPWESIGIHQVGGRIYMGPGVTEFTSFLGDTYEVIYEERPFKSVPDSGATLALVGVAMAGLAVIRRRR